MNADEPKNESEHAAPLDRGADAEHIRPEPPDPFNPAALRVGANYAQGLGVQRILTTIPVRKPHKTEWFRVRPGPEWRIETTIFETEGVERATYLVISDLRQAFGSSLSVATLLLCVNRSGDPFLWRIKLPNADGRMNPWSQSALEAAVEAEQRWCRLEPNMQAGYYNVYTTTSEWSEPKWPELAFRDVLQLAFRERLIDTPDHVLLRDLRGLS